MSDTPNLRVSYKNRDVSGEPQFTALVNQYSDREFASPRRSTVPLLACWQPMELGLARLSRALGRQLTGDVHLSFEHCVPVRRGIGRDSQTDLMVIIANEAIAVEAKATEPEYQTVGRWLAASDGPNRMEVLLGWLELINGASASNLSPDDVTEVTYQLIHRTASACFISDVSWSAVIYQVFSSKEKALSRPSTNRYLEQMRGLQRRLADSSRLSFYVLECEFKERERYRELIERWNRNERQLGSEARQALLAGDLVECGEWKLTEA
jgi:hypothetical protein